ncbi:response regulator [Gorillibacterium timonense]
MEIHPDAVRLVDLADHLRQLFAPLAVKNGVDFRVHVEKSSPSVLYTDGHRVQQILKNLLGNAFKFTREGSVTLTVSAESGGDSSVPDVPRAEGEAVRFEVKDTGIGISDEKLSLIFEAFRQADGSTGRRFGGTGLGLSISLELARLLGGTITVESEPDRGSAFALTLPDLRSHPALSGHAEAAASAESDATPDAEAQAVFDSGCPILAAGTDTAAETGDEIETAPFAGKSILLVDDDIRNVFALSSFLENYDMRVTFAENGREALDVLRRNPDFDLVLMDIMMPEMDGYETMRRIREQPEFDDLPIIALTAKAMREDRSRCMENGASDYMAKPIDTNRLLSLLKVWLYK